MKKLLSLLIGILIFSMMFTACNTPAESPTDVKSKTEQTVKGAVQSLQETVSEPKTQLTVQEETKQQDTSLDDSSKADISNDNAKEEGQNFDACVGVADPTFTSEQGLRNWLLAKEVNVFEEERDQYLTRMADDQKIVYYAPKVPDESVIMLERIVVIPNHSTYYYSFTDEKYKNIQFLISEYTGIQGDSLKENYEHSLSEFTKGNPDASMFGTKEMPILCYENKLMNSLGYIWYQHGGYQSALILCDSTETLPPREYVVPYLNLEKVTLRTDLETH